MSPAGGSGRAGLDVLSAVRDRARVEPHRTAVEDGPTRLSYGQLVDAADALAARLGAAGAGPGDLVGVYGTRSAEVVAGLLGVWVAGAAFVPLDQALPVGRLAGMADDGGVRVVVATGAVPEQLARGRRVVPVAGAPVPTGAAPVARRPGGGSGLAYVLYTSGSTGRPKGVMVEHTGLAGYLRWAVEEYGAATGDGLLHGSLGVDLTVTSLLAPLLGGRAVLVAPAGRGGQPVTAMLDRLPDLAFLKLTPSHLVLLDGALHRRPPTDWAGCLVVGGEQLTAEQLASWRAFAPRSTVVNEYGPTETVVGCCASRIRAADLARSGVVPIGRPAAGAELLVLDERLRPVPAGVDGELYVGGPGVARGYLGRPGLTAERFLPHPSRPGARVYRTGDLVRVTASGDLAYRGRADDQVKIAGHRVELGEIEGLLREHGAVADAVATWRPEDQELLAFVRLRPGPGPAAVLAELDRLLVDRLPPYLVPELVVHPGPWPETPSGKTDRRALADRGTG